MAFCASCGAPVEGRFCAKCGASMPAGGAAPDPGAAAGAQYSNPQPGYSAPQAVAGSGMEDNLAGALCYVMGFITGVLFLVLEPYNKRPFVRYHAFQSIFFNVGVIALFIALGIVGMILSAIVHLFAPVMLPVNLIVYFLVFAMWLVCMFKAYNRQWFQLPVVGALALKQSGAGQAS